MKSILDKNCNEVVFIFYNIIETRERDSSFVEICFEENSKERSTLKILFMWMNIYAIHVIEIKLSEKWKNG